MDSDRALDDAGALDREAAEGRFRGPLHGLPVAIKDVMDVAGLPTRCNSRTLQDRAPATADAEIVTQLRAAGGRAGQGAHHGIRLLRSLAGRNRDADGGFRQPARRLLLREAVETGVSIGDDEFRTLYRSLAAAHRGLFESVADAHAVLWPAAPDTAPPGLAWTGDPRYIAPWIAFGGPVVTVNVGADGAGLPIGAPGTDADFTGIARRLATALEV